MAGAKATILVGLIEFLLVATFASGQPVWYVDDDQCPNTGTGTEGNPFCKIQHAITASTDDDTVRVAAGTYVENLDFLGRAVTVLGVEGPELTTIQTEHAERIVTFNTSEGPKSILEGFTISGGSNGGIICMNSSPTIRDCIIENNQAETGAGIELVGASPTLSQCTIRGNVAANIGGGINCNAESNPVIESSTIEQNEAEHGGGLYIVNGSSPLIRGCYIEDNTAGGSAGGISCAGATSRPTIDDCTIARNRATVGAGMNCGESSPIIKNCLFEYNIATDTAGGINCKDHASPTITRCVFQYNEATLYTAGGLKCNLYSNPIVGGCTFYQNRAVHGGGMYILDNSSPVVRRCSFLENTAFEDRVNEVGGSGGGVVAGGGDPLFDGCRFERNRSEAGGGMVCGAGNPTIVNSRFVANEATQIGGGITVNNSQPTIVNCHLFGNTAGYGGGAIYNYNANGAVFVNCTITGSAASEGWAIWAGNASHPTLTNCILWDNGSASRIYEDATSSVTVTYSDVQYGYPGLGNINDNPLFDGAFQLLSGSPCIDRGNNAAVPVGLLIDYEGLPRFTDDPFTVDLGSGTAPLVDMGASEYRDCNLNGISDFTDVTDCIGEGWCIDDNENNVPDTCEIPGDLNFDGDTDLTDVAIFMACLAGPFDNFPSPDCPSWTAFKTADLNLDGWVDLKDAAAFTRAFDAQ